MPAFSCSLTLTLLLLGPYTPLAFLGLRPGGGRSCDFLTSVITWTNSYNKLTSSYKWCTDTDIGTHRDYSSPTPDIDIGVGRGTHSVFFKKKAEHRRIDAFEVWCWRRLLRVPWTARRSNQSILKEISRGAVVQWITRLTTTDQKILKEISPEYSLEGLMLKLKLQYFGYLIRRTDSLVKILMLGDWRQEEKGMTDG